MAVLTPEQKTRRQNRLLLIVNFNWQHYNNIPILRDLYQEYADIVFYGDSDAVGRHPHNVITIPQCKGYFAYRAWMDAIYRFPGYQGYIFLMDDLLLRPGLLHEFSRDVCWFDDQYPFNHLPLQKSPQCKSEWVWMSTQYGREAAQRLLQRLSNEDREALVARIGRTNSIYHAMSDFFYIPQHLAADALRIFSQCSTEELFIEIAVPLTLLIISDPQTWHVARVKFLWGKERAQWENYLGDTSFDGVHPVKIGRSHERKIVRREFGMSPDISLTSFLTWFLNWCASFERFFLQQYVKWLPMLRRPPAKFDMPPSHDHQQYLHSKEL